MNSLVYETPFHMKSIYQDGRAVPAGKSQACDYTAIHNYPAAPASPLNDDQMASMLKKTALKMSLQEYRELQCAVFELVYTNISQTRKVRWPKIRRSRNTM